MLCLRKPHWPTLLVILGIIWVGATSLTASGIYLLIRHPETQHLEVSYSSGRLHRVWKQETWWTAQDGQLLVVAGCISNGMLLVVMLLYRIMEGSQLRNILNQEPPPDYERIIREETPPPSYSDLNLVFSSTSLSSSSSSLAHVWKPTLPLSLNCPVTAV